MRLGGKKTCAAEGCGYPIFGKGYCQMHQYLRTDKKPVRINSAGIKPDQKELFEKDKAFYLEIWNERSHICEHCGAYLGNEPRTYFFDHVLEKAKRAYRHLRHEKMNIWLLCLNCHGNKTNGFLTEKMKEKIFSIKKIFNLQ